MKRHNNLITILLFTSSFIIAGCGENKQKNPPSVTSDSGGSASGGSASGGSASGAVVPLLLTPQNIKGVWMQNCKTDPSGLFKFTKKFIYTTNKLDYVLTYYSIRAEDKGVCATEEYKIEITSDIVFNEVINKGSENEQTKIDMTANKAVVTILSPALVTTINTATQYVRKNTYNDNFGLNIIHWVIDQPRDLTIEYIRDKIFGLGVPELDIYHVSGDKLYFGDKNGNLDSDNRPMTLSTNALSRNLQQWAATATASSQFTTTAFAAHQASGLPDTGKSVGSGEIRKMQTWSEHYTHWAQLNTLTLTYAVPVKISLIIVRETLNPGTISKVEVKKNDSFFTVYSKNGGNEIGGSMSGVQPQKISDARITLNPPLDYYSNKIRITNGNHKKVYNHIDAVKLVGKP
ncbi:MAG: hypothetical protein KAH18_04940 [Psychromonas sp.]|nr:hypothetical protein [Psychromonas sp.]